MSCGQLHPSNVRGVSIMFNSQAQSYLPSESYRHCPFFPIGLYSVDTYCSPPPLLLFASPRFSSRSLPRSSSLSYRSLLTIAPSSLHLSSLSLPRAVLSSLLLGALSLPRSSSLRSSSLASPSSHLLSSLSRPRSSSLRYLFLAPPPSLATSALLFSSSLRSQISPFVS